MVRPDFVRRKLHLITDDLGRLLPFRKLSLRELLADAVKLAAAERLLERIVMRAIDINQHLIAELSPATEERTVRLTYQDTFLRLAGLGVYPDRFAKRLAPSAGLRNILVHDYNDVDHKILHASISRFLSDYRAYATHILKFLSRCR